MLRRIANVLVVALPWPLKRAVMTRLFGYELDPTARIGFSLIEAGHVHLAARARIGHFNMVRTLDRVVLGRNASIGHFNQIIGGRPSSGRFYPASPDRRPELALGEYASITRRHLIDCADFGIRGPLLHCCRLGNPRS